MHLDSLLFALFVFAVLLTIVAVLGHGLWLLVAAILRALTGSTHARRSASRLICPNCGTGVSATTGSCPGCGWNPDIKPVAATPQVELQQILNRVRNLHARGLISNESVAQLNGLIRNEMARLEGLTAPTPVAGDDLVEAMLVEATTTEQKPARPPLPPRAARGPRAAEPPVGASSFQPTTPDLAGAGSDKISTGLPTSDAVPRRDHRQTAAAASTRAACPTRYIRRCQTTQDWHYASSGCACGSFSRR